ncbi:hypothetical protein ACGFSI_41030 [Streptomyces virginiae]|uniref:hypothetical protein n=1 Tax=Streptomyces virginiae TaxID=1961 RepID=UPI003720B096
MQRAQAKALACQLPAETGVPLSRWSCPELAVELEGRGITGPISPSTVRRWLREEAIKPWQHRSWIFITDPAFRPKAERVLDLYARAFNGEPLGADEYVISADEKTSIQARCRCHPTLAPGQARAMRVNHTYGRGGALAYLAAYDVHQARVFGRTEPRTGIDPFMALVAQVMSQEPYASAKRVFWIVDNGSSHRGQAAADRMTAAFPNAVLMHTPIHASWTFDEIKNHLGPGGPIRSRTPEGVRQELRAYLGATATKLTRSFTEARREARARLLPARRNRDCPRAIKKPNRWPVLRTRAGRGAVQPGRWSHNPTSKPKSTRQAGRPVLRGTRALSPPTD